MARTSFAKYLRNLEREKQTQAAHDAARASQSRIDALKSAHRDCSEAIDWYALAASLPLPAPVVDDSAEASAKRRRGVLEALGVEGHRLPDVREARDQVAQEMDLARRAHVLDLTEQADSVALARGILREDAACYLRVLRERAFEQFLPGGEVSVEFTVHTAQLVEASISAPGSAVLPDEVQSVSARGKLSTKAMPRQQFVELYQDYVCSLVLRVTRELHALLPIEAALVNALTSDGLPGLAPVLSTIIYRHQLERLSFDGLDPSDALDDLQTRTNFKASRRTGTFQPIVPFRRQDVRHGRGSSLSSLKAVATDLLEELE